MTPEWKPLQSKKLSSLRGCAREMILLRNRTSKADWPGNTAFLTGQGRETETQLSLEHQGGAAFSGQMRWSYLGNLVISLNCFQERLCDSSGYTTGAVAAMTLVDFCWLVGHWEHVLREHCGTLVDSLYSPCFPAWRKKFYFIVCSCHDVPSQPQSNMVQQHLTQFFNQGEPLIHKWSL